jgi:hypothetical protein
VPGRISPFSVGVLFIALLFAGCGSSSPKPPLSPAVFANRANKICAEAEAAVEKETRTISEGLSGSSEDDLASYVFNFLDPWVGTAMSELGDLGLPKRKAKQAEGMIEAYEATLAHMESHPKLVLKDDPFAAANKMAKNLGLADCVI